MANKLQVIFEIVGKGTDQLNKVQGEIDRFTKKTGDSFRSLASLPNIVMGAGLFKITEGFISAADAVQGYRNQLLRLSDSAAQAEESLSAIREWGRTSPLETKDIVESYIKLRAVGIDPTMKQMKVLGNVARMFRTDLGDVASGFIGMNARTLRQLGIEIDQTGKTAVIASGDIRAEVEKNAPAIRAALLDIWEKRFPDAVVGSVETVKAKMAIFRSNIFELQAQIGEAFIGQVGGSIDEINKKFDSLSENINTMIFALTAAVTPITILWNGAQIMADTAANSILTSVDLLAGSVDTLKALYETVSYYVGESGKDYAARVGTAWSKVGARMDELKARGKLLASETSKNFDDIAAAMLRFTAAYEKVGEKVTRSTASLPGTGKNLGGDTTPTGAGSGAGDLRKSDISSGVNRWVSGDTAMIDSNQKSYDEMYGQYMAFSLKMSTSSELLTIRMADIWTEFTDSLTGRFKGMFDTLTDLHMSWKDKFGSIMEAGYRMSTDILFEYLAAFIKTKLIERTVSIATERMQQTENLKTAGTAMVKASAEGAGAVAGVPIIGPILAVAAAASIFAMLSGMVSKGKTGYANGTDYASPGLHMVGERGPELVRFRGGEQVFANGKGGGGVNINMTINGNADKTVVDYAVGKLERIANDIREATRRGYLRPGMV